MLILNLNPGGPEGGSGTQYFVGDFDGTEFTLAPAFARTLERQEAVWLDHGADSYAGVTWSDVPAAEGRRIFMGWIGSRAYAQEVRTDRWRSAFSEAFADDGTTVTTESFFPSVPFSRMAIYGTGGPATLLEGRAWRPEGIWE